MGIVGMFLSCSVHLTQSHIQMSYESFGSLLNEAVQCDLEALLSSRPQMYVFDDAIVKMCLETSNRATTISTPFVSGSNCAIRRITDPGKCYGPRRMLYDVVLYY